MLGEEHHYKYSHRRPHSSLGDLNPAEFASRLSTSAAASVLHSEEQHEPTTTPTLIGAGSKNGGTPAQSRAGHSSFEPVFLAPRKSSFPE